MDTEKRLKVLVIDDDPDDQAIAQLVLGEEFALEKAESSKEAIEKMETTKFDAALIDVRLGADSGIDLALQFKNSHPEMALIICSSFPESYEGISGNFDGCIMKGSYLNNLRGIIRNCVHKKRLPGEEILIRDRILRQFEPASKSLIHDVHIETTSDSALGYSERMLGRWRDGWRVAWTGYRLEQHAADWYTVGVACTVGCGLGCRFCMHAKKKRARLLKPDEIMTQVLYLLLDSGHIQGIFRELKKTQVFVNFTCEGEPYSNLKNVAEAIWRMASVDELKLRFILTSIGLEKRLRDFIKHYRHIPEVRQYWSANSLRDSVRRKLMPSASQENLHSLLNLYEQIAEISGEKVTASFILIPGINDSEEESKTIIETLKGRPFIVKLQPFAGAPGFQPFETASDEQLETFRQRLEDGGIPCRVRHVIGGDYYGGCGTTVPLYRRQIGFSKPNLDRLKKTGIRISKGGNRDSYGVPKKFSGLIFDADGVLIRSANNYRDAVDKLGRREMTGTDWISDLAVLQGIDPLDRKLIAKISLRNFEATKNSLTAFSWVGWLIPALAKKVPLAICTNNSRRALEYALGPILEYFISIRTYEDVKELKPSPEGLLSICEELELDPSNVLFLGNSMVDEIAALNAGMPVLIVSWGKEQLAKEVSNLFNPNPIKSQEGWQLSSPESLLELV